MIHICIYFQCLLRCFVPLQQCQKVLHGSALMANIAMIWLANSNFWVNILRTKMKKTQSDSLRKEQLTKHVSLWGINSSKKYWDNMQQQKPGWFFGNLFFSWEPVAVAENHFFRIKFPLSTLDFSGFQAIWYSSTSRGTRWVLLPVIKRVINGPFIGVICPVTSVTHF